ncbi:MAG: hypothetical protein M9904_15820 [Chitinophagaceae bacterium]|nr:hypothetical protein [Chitinophagaceae bacterium]
MVELSGRASARAWIGKDGEAKAGLNFHTSDIKPLGGSKRAETAQATTGTNEGKATPQETTDDLPF